VITGKASHAQAPLGDHPSVLTVPLHTGPPLRLALRVPFAARELFAHLAARAVPGVEEATASTLRRTVRLARGPAVISLAGRADHVLARAALADRRDRAEALRRCRALLDLDADPVAIDAALARDPGLAPLVRAAPGLRSPGAVDGGEILVRAIVGQQVSVAAARTVLGRLASGHGDPIDGERLRLFPAPETLAALDPGTLPMPAARGRALVGAAAALASGDLDLEPGADPVRARAVLLALPGVGPWTASYVAMRALRDPDVLMAGDLGLRRGLERCGLPAERRALERRAEDWRPWRSYATHHLWRAASPAAG